MKIGTLELRKTTVNDQRKEENESWKRNKIV